MSEKNLVELAQCLNLLELEEDEYVFDYEEEGDLFYIILSGSVSVHVPDQKTGELRRSLSIFERTQLSGKDLNDLIRFIEVVRLNAGASFGELALQAKGGTRKARVICREDCKFATVNKDNYQKVLQKIQQQTKEKFVKFLRQIPFISHWSKNAITKLYYAIEKVDFKRGQKVIKEGDPIDYVYIVSKGEFELTKNLSKIDDQEKEHNEEENLIRPLLNHEDAKRCKARKITQEWRNPSRVKRKIRLAILGECKLFCDNDARFEKPSSVTVTAGSLSGEVYRISVNEFMKYIKNDKEAWEKFTKLCFDKEVLYGKRIHAYVKNVKPKKVNLKAINLLEQRQKNLDTNIGEIDVRHSLERVSKTMDYRSTRSVKTYENPHSSNRATAMPSVFKNLDHSNEPQSSVRMSVDQSMTNELNHYLLNSPSRQGRRLLKMNPVYQKKYLSNCNAPELKSGRAVTKHQFMLKAKSGIDKFMSSRRSNIRVKLRNKVLQEKLNRSVDQTSSSAHRMSMASTINKNRLFNKLKYFSGKQIDQLDPNNSVDLRHRTSMVSKAKHHLLVQTNHQ